MSEEFEQLDSLAVEDQGQAEPEAGRTAGMRRGWFMGLVAAAAVAVVAGIVLLVGGLQGGAPEVKAVPSVSYSPAPVVTEPFGPSDPDTYKDAPGLKADPSGPSTLSIPSIGVAVKFESKGLLPGKVLDLPETGAALYDQSAPVDATEGVTVFSGHVNTATNAKGPLGGLADVQKGAPVTVTDAAGTAHAYRIVSLSTVDKDKLDPAWFTRTGAREVVLITCGGQVQGYNSYGLPIYTHNTVAVAVPAA